MTNNRNTPHGEPPAELSDDAAAFDDEGLSPMSEEELQERNFRSEILLEQERAEREAFAEELEEELEALFATIKRGEADLEEDLGRADPPGWPAF